MKDARNKVFDEDDKITIVYVSRIYHDLKKDEDLEVELDKYMIERGELGESLTEEVDKDLDKKLKAHNDYIEYLKKMIEQEEAALKSADNDEIKAAIQRRLDAFTADLEAALPDALKEPAVEEVVETEETVEEVPSEEPVETEETVEEALTEEADKDAEAAGEISTEEETPVEEAEVEASEEVPAEEPKEVDYVEYKHSYCHALAPKLKALNYLAHVKKIEVEKMIGYILKLLKDGDVKWTEKEKEFVKNIKEKTDLNDIYNYVKNSIEKAKTIKVKVDANGELVESLNEGFEGCVYEESLNNPEAQKDAAEHSELYTENHSDNLTLNESVESDVLAVIDSWSSPVEEALTEEEAVEVDAEVDNLENEEEQPIEEEPQPIETTVEEVKEVATAVAEEVLDEVDAEAEPEVVEDVVNEVVEEKLGEEKPEEDEVEETEEVEECVKECGEKPVEGEKLNESPEDELNTLLNSDEFQKPISDAEVKSYFKEEAQEEPLKEEFTLESVENLDEETFNSHVKDFLTEVYDNVQSYETTGCSLADNKLVVEGKISFKSGTTKLTVFEFLPAYDEGKLFLEGYNKDFSEDKAFKLNFNLTEDKSIKTDSINYRFTINESLIEGTTQE